MSNSGKILPMAISVLHEGRKAEFVGVFRELCSFLKTKDYGADRLYCDSKKRLYINLRERDSND